jgi:Zn finger protein HypA/HybF involved in hydrogenase expression
MSVEIQPSPLECVECGSTSEQQARGWKLYLGSGAEFDELELAVYCPDCAEREFGDR